jgi:hypothetical protein
VVVSGSGSSSGCSYSCSCSGSSGSGGGGFYLPVLISYTALQHMVLVWSCLETGHMKGIPNIKLN